MPEIMQFPAIEITDVPAGDQNRITHTQNVLDGDIGEMTEMYQFVLRMEEADHFTTHTGANISYQPLGDIPTTYGLNPIVSLPIGGGTADDLLG